MGRLVPASLLVFTISVLVAGARQGPMQEWPVYGGDPGGAKASPLADINQANVDRAVKDYNATPTSTSEILYTPCDVLSPCALGGVIDGHVAAKLRCPIVCPGANNVLDDPDEDAVILKSRGILYVPDFIANAGGVIHLAGLYVGYPEKQLAQKIADIESTALQVFKDADQHTSTHAAAVALGDRRIAEGADKGRRREEMAAG